MPVFSDKSKGKLDSCHQSLKILFNQVVLNFDCTILEGHRCKKNQDLYFYRGLSKVKWPNSKHNADPSRAVDVVPYVVGKLSFDMLDCCYFAGYVKAVADRLGIKIRWGGDWNRDDCISNNSFQDLVHFELDE